MNRIAVAVTLMCTLLVVAATATTACAAAPSMAQVREAYEAGQYPAALKMITECLALKGPAAEGYDRYELYTLKGECLVSLKSAAYAAEAFEDAQAAASDDPAKRAAAMASELVLRRSPAMKYVPKTGTDLTPINVIPIDSRKRAMTALRADLLAQLKPKINEALKADVLTPTMSLLAPLREVAVLEFGATGQVEEIRPILAPLGARAREMIVHELKVRQEEVEQLNAAASDIYMANGFAARRGLHSEERKDLAGMVEYLRQIEAVACEGRRIAILLGGKVDAWEQIVTVAEDQVIRAEGLLNRPL